MLAGSTLLDSRRRGNLHQWPDRPVHGDGVFVPSGGHCLANSSNRGCLAIEANSEAEDPAHCVILSWYLVGARHRSLARNLSLITSLKESAFLVSSVY